MENETDTLEEQLEDEELNRLADQRSFQPEIPVSLEDL